MHPVDVEEALKTLTVIVDTREQDTAALSRRLEKFPRHKREKLNAGDYSGKLLINGDWFYMPVAIERKMSIDELCACYCQQRPRFEREFERAKDAGIKMYLLIEGGSWETIYSDLYQSHMRPRSLVGSILTWLSRYNAQILMCKPNTTGQLIWDILYYEARQTLLNMEAGEMDSG